ncbi:MAG: SLC13 family permease [Lachnospirales bacterium]
MENLILAVSIFVVVYGIIISEKINKVAIAMIGASIIIILKIIDFDVAVTYIDYNTIGLLVGMMVIVSVLRSTGVFEYLAIYVAKRVKGNPWGILSVLGIMTAVASSFLDNVTVVLLVVPVTLVITETLEIDPKPILISQILLSNVGGTATLIGDPPNVMIGSSTHLTFNDFIINLGPVVLVTVVVFLGALYLLYGKNMGADEKNIKKLMRLDEKLSIRDKGRLKKSLVILFMTIVSFWLAEFFDIELAVMALFFAGIIVAVTKVDIEEVFLHVEWSSIAFFIGLFVMVGALQEVGAIDILAQGMLDVTKGDLLITTLVILWGSGIVSSFLNNIPFVATMIPLITTLGADGMTTEPLWWALALGACFGGNGTIIGSSAGVIVAGASDKQGYKITFGEYMKVGMPLTILSLIVSTVFLYAKYFA